MGYYPEPDSHQIMLLKKELDHTTGFDTSDLAAKKISLLGELKLTN